MQFRTAFLTKFKIVLNSVHEFIQIKGFVVPFFRLRCCADSLARGHCFGLFCPLRPASLWRPRSSSRRPSRSERCPSSRTTGSLQARSRGPCGRSRTGPRSRRCRRESQSGPHQLQTPRAEKRLHGCLKWKIINHYLNKLKIQLTLLSTRRALLNFQSCFYSRIFTFNKKVISHF